MYGAALPGSDPDADFDWEVLSDARYPGLWRVTGSKVESLADMTNWDWPEASQRFARVLNALGVLEELARRGAAAGDTIMVGATHDFEYAAEGWRYGASLSSALAAPSKVST